MYVINWIYLIYWINVLIVMLWSLQVWRTHAIMNDSGRLTSWSELFSTETHVSVELYVSITQYLPGMCRRACVCVILPFSIVQHYLWVSNRATPICHVKNTHLAKRLYSQKVPRLNNAFKKTFISERSLWNEVCISQITMGKFQI